LRFEDGGRNGDPIADEVGQASRGHVFTSTEGTWEITWTGRAVVSAPGALAPVTPLGLDTLGLGVACCPTVATAFPRVGLLPDPIHRLLGDRVKYLGG
jgi:hypothetical protein